MTIKVGDRLPSVTLQLKDKNGGIVETLNIEEDGKFEISDADTIIKTL